MSGYSRPGVKGFWLNDMDRSAQFAGNGNLSGEA